MFRQATSRLPPPGAFAFVMAIGIVCAALNLTGWHRCSVALLIVAAAALILLSALTVTRTVLYRQEVISDALDPKQGFGFVTIVAALNVVGIDLHSPGRPWPTIVLAVISVPAWLLLTYGIPSTLILRAREEPVAGQVDGGWFLWVVGRNDGCFRRRGSGRKALCDVVQSAQSEVRKPPLVNFVGRCLRLCAQTR